MLQPVVHNNSGNIVPVKKEVEDGIEMHGIINTVAVQDPVIAVDLMFEEDEDGLDYEGSGEDPEIAELQEEIKDELKEDINAIKVENVWSKKICERIPHSLGKSNNSVNDSDEAYDEMMIGAFEAYSKASNHPPPVANNQSHTNSQSQYSYNQNSPAHKQSNGGSPGVQSPNSTLQDNQLVQYNHAINYAKKIKFQWEAGNYCRAVCPSDNLVYEAEVVSVSGSKCTVDFLGYNEGAEIDTSTLSKSKGKIARKKQIKQAYYPAFQWAAGDYCRAVYPLDNLVYEAEVVSVSGDKCIVSFFGYNEGAEVDADTLSKSKGKAARKKQIKQAYFSATGKKYKEKGQKTRARAIVLKPAVDRQIREIAKNYKGKVQQTRAERIALKPAFGRQIRETTRNYTEKVQQTRAKRIALQPAVDQQIREAIAEFEEATNSMKGEKKQSKKISERIPRSLRKSNNCVNYSDEAYDKMMLGAIESDSKAEADLEEATNATILGKRPYSRRSYERSPRSLRESHNNVNYSDEAYDKMILGAIEFNRQEYSSESENSDRDKESATGKNYKEKGQQSRAAKIALKHAVKHQNRETGKNYKEKGQQTRAARIALKHAVKHQNRETKAAIKEATSVMEVGKECGKKIYEKIPRSLRKSNNSVNYSDEAYDKMMLGAIECDSKTIAAVKEATSVMKVGKECSKKIYERIPRSLRKSNNSVNYSDEAYYKMMLGAIESDSKNEVAIKETSSVMKVEKEHSKKICERITRSLRKSNNSVNYSDEAYDKMILGTIESDSKAKAEPRDAINAVKGEKKQSKKIYERIPRSLRKLNNSVNYSEEALRDRMMLEAIEPDRKIIPPELKFKDAMFEGLYANYVQDVDVCEPKSELNLVYDKSVLENLTLKESNVKITPERITALALYPSSENIIIAAGSKHGNLGIWNAVSKSSPYGFKMHLDSITHLAFNPYNPIQLISSSLDGTLRCCDMKKHVFSEICNVSDVASCANFDFLSPTTYLLAHSNGEITLIDSRTEGYKCEKKHINKMIKCVNVHPVNKDIFLTGGSLGSICLWDLRNLQKQPVAEIINHEKCVQTAYFSPVSGNSILSSSCDSICISDCSNLTDVKLKKDMKYKVVHDPLFTFKASWLPYSDEAFSVGSKEIPRKLQICNTDFDVLHSVMNGKIVCGLHINVFHPFKPFIFGNNVNGKIFVFTDL